MELGAYKTPYHLSAYKTLFNSLYDHFYRAITVPYAMHFAILKSRRNKVLNISLNFTLNLTVANAVLLSLYLTFSRIVLYS